MSGMPERNVLCDDCLLNYGITTSPMAKTDRLSLIGPTHGVPARNELSVPARSILQFELRIFQLPERRRSFEDAAFSTLQF